MGRLNEETGLKECSKCHDDKTADCFGKMASAMDGLQSVCRECRAAQKKAYKLKNPDKIKAQNAGYRKKGGQELKEKQHEWYMDNRDKILDKAKERYVEKHAEITAYKKDYYKTELGVITRIYGHQKQSSHQRYHPMPNYTKEELSMWVYKNGFKRVYDEWVASGYDKDMKPSVDRIDSYIPYKFRNMQIMTWGENSAKGHEGIRSTPILRLDVNAGTTTVFDTLDECVLNAGVTRKTLRKYLRTGEARNGYLYGTMGLGDKVTALGVLYGWYKLMSPEIPFSEFIEKVTASSLFRERYSAWVGSGYERKLKPSMAAVVSLTDLIKKE